MANKITCGKCGEENSQESKYCFNCGQKLNKSVTTKKKPSTTINTDYPDIKKALQRLIKVKGFLAISIGEYYVQFFNKPKENILVFEAVSGNFHHLVRNKDKDFEAIGFLLKPKENYIKHIPLVIFSVNETIRDIKTIFEDIYQVEFSSYKIESDFDYSKPMVTPTTAKKENSTFKIIAIVGFVFLIFVYIFDKGDNNDYNSSNHSSQYDNYNGASNSSSTRGNDIDKNAFLAYRYATDFVKDRLKSPSTAKFPGRNERAGHIINLGNGRYKIDSWVDSQNGFGATIRSNWTCTIILEDKQVFAEDLVIY